MHGLILPGLPPHEEVHEEHRGVGEAGEETEEPVPEPAIDGIEDLMVESDDVLDHRDAAPVAGRKRRPRPRRRRAPGAGRTAETLRARRPRTRRRRARW